MNSEKTTLSSLRNIELRTVKAKTNKVNQVLTYISTNNIIELNELNNAGAKIGTPQKARKKNQNQDGNFDRKRR